MVKRARAWSVVVVGALVGATALTVPTSSVAAPPTSAKVDGSLGNGLGRLLAQSGTARQRRVAGGHLDQEMLTIRDGQGRVLVDLTPQAGVNRAAFRRSAEDAGLVVRATEPRHGMLEGFVALHDVERLNALPGRGTLAQALKARTNVGAATSQGVALQRINQVQKRGLDGKGVTVAALSDSYDTATRTIDGDPLTIHAKQDIASGDLPGPANPTYSKPVTVLEDSDNGNDEGRAMLQIAHDIAPAADLCFATAEDGEVGFAENIRKLADPAGPCGADVIVDDVGYYAEPVYGDGLISDAVDDVAGAGVHYFSSAGNTTPEESSEGRLHLVSTARARQTSDIDLSDVDPALYDGGFQDLQPGAGVDVAQTVALGEEGGIFDLQWDDPTDYAGARLGAPYLSESGTISGAEPEASFAFTPKPSQLGKTVLITADGIPTGSTDLILDLKAPDGTEIGPIDTGTSPEQIATTLSQAGTYTITVSGFDGATGPFTLDVRPVLEKSKVTTDLNLLFFDPSGAFLGAAADVNQLTGRPVEVTGFAGIPEVQVVVARAGNGRTKVSRVSLQLGGDAAFAEHTRPQARAIYGHPTALGATGVAAFDPFRPYLPEFFTSPGGRFRLLYDSAGRPLPKSRQVRRSPQIASTDGGNTTFFVRDTTLDPDGQPNFFGTSAAAPHAAGIAALAVQRARKQDRSLSPAALRRAMERSTFEHDLDPALSKGEADGVTLTANGTQSQESEPVPGSMVDPRFFTVRNRHGKTVRSIVLDGSTASPSASGGLGSSRSSGIVFDPRPYDPSKPRRLVGFPFTIGGTGGGLTRSSVTASYAAPNGEGQYGQLVLTFGKGLKRGQSVQFGIDRDLAVSYYGAKFGDPVQPVPAANEGNGADELGGAVLLPSGQKDRSGLTFTVERATGKRSSGQLRNKLGSGFTAIDGYGLVDAEKAVLGG